MKTLKFHPHLSEKILRGEKTTTWRMFDDKNISIDDEISMINSETKEEFGKSTVIRVWEKPFSKLADEEFDGHKKFDSDKEMYAKFSEYYCGRPVDENTIVKIIRFRLK